MYCVLFFYTSIRMPVIGVGVLVLSELLWRRCVISIRSVFLLLQHSARVFLSPGVR